MCSQGQHNNRKDRKMYEQLTTTNSPYTILTEIKPGFEDTLNWVIENIFAELSENKQAIYRYLETNYGIKKDEIAFKLEDFALAINQTFGPAAKIIQIKIIERLHARFVDFSYTPNDNDLNFLDFLTNLRHYLSQNYY